MKKIFIAALRVFIVIWSIMIIIIHYKNMSKNLLEEHYKDISATIEKFKK